MEPKLPRLLGEGRVEVRLSSVGGTYVFEESGIDRLLKHLLDAKELLRPVEPGSPEGKRCLYLERKIDVARTAKVVLPYLMEEADKADEQDEKVATVTVASLYSACNVMAFIDNLGMYEKDLREEMERLEMVACTMCVSSKRGPARIVKEIIDEVDGTTADYLQLEDGSGIGVSESDLYLLGYKTGYAQRGMESYGSFAGSGDSYDSERKRAEMEHPAAEWATKRAMEMVLALEREVEELKVALWQNDLDGEHGVIREAIHVRIVAERISEEMQRRRSNEQ